MDKIVGAIRQASKKYPLIEQGDHIAVGVSGGADSLVLLAALAELAKYAPQQFTLSAITIDMGFAKAGIGKDNKEDWQRLREYIADLKVPYHIVPSNLAHTIFNERKEKNPCALCARIRRGALNFKCKEIGANKLALAHHSEDILMTFLLSFLYEARLSTLQPYSYMSRTGITLIRPFIYVNEADIKHLASRLEMPIMANPCPEDKNSRREYMKELVKGMQKEIPFADKAMFSAIISPERYNLWNQFEKEDK